MNILPILVVMGFFLVFSGAVYLMIKTSRNAQALNAQQIATLGFKAPESTPSLLQARVEDLYRTYQEGELTLDQVYCRRELDREIYLFDLYSTHGEGTELGKEIFGVISRELALPHFNLITIPDFDSDSLLGGLMEKMLAKVMTLAEKKLGLERIAFPERPEIEEHFVVFGQDPPAVRALFERVSLDRLPKSPQPVQIGGIGDFLTVDFSMSGETSDQKLDLISQYNNFQEIALLFSRSS